MTLHKSYKSVITFTVIWSITFFLQRFKLYTFESDHLFLWDCDWILEQLYSVGGFNLLASSFFLQFFRFTIIGTTVTAAIYYIIIQCGIKLISRIDSNCYAKTLSTIPVGFLILCIEDQFYGYRSHVALAFCLLAVVAYYKIVDKNHKSDIPTCLFFTVATYFVIGSVAVLFASTILIINISTQKRALPALISLAAVMLCGFAANRFGRMASFEESVSPLMYYNWPTGYKTHLLAWISIPASLLVTFALSKIRKYGDIAFQSILTLSFVCIILTFKQVHDTKTSKLQQECYLADNGRWDDIISLNQKKNEPTYLISYTNLALAQQGKLLDQMFLFEQQLPIQQTDIKKVSNAILRMTSQVYHYCGYVAGARKSAFNSSLITAGGFEPHDMLNLLAADKAIGTKETCGKYADLLSKTLFYSAAARKALDEEPVQLPASDNFCEIHGLGYDFEQIAKANPQNNIAKQFNLAYLLLSADKEKIHEYVSSKADGETLHRRIQEACAIMFSADECKTLGIDEDVINDFEKLKKGQKINGFENSYWYYIAYLNINLKADQKNHVNNSNKK